MWLTLLAWLCLWAVAGAAAAVALALLWWLCVGGDLEYLLSQFLNIGGLILLALAAWSTNPIGKVPRHRVSRTLFQHPSFDKALARDLEEHWGSLLAGLAAGGGCWALQGILAITLGWLY